MASRNTVEGKRCGLQEAATLLKKTPKALYNWREGSPDSFPKVDENGKYLFHEILEFWITHKLERQQRLFLFEKWAREDGFKTEDRPANPVGRPKKETGDLDDLGRAKLEIEVRTKLVDLENKLRTYADIDIVRDMISDLAVRIRKEVESIQQRTGDPCDGFESAFVQFEERLRAAASGVEENE